MLCSFVTIPRICSFTMSVQLAMYREVQRKHDVCVVDHVLPVKWAPVPPFQTPRLLNAISKAIDSYSAVTRLWSTEHSVYMRPRIFLSIGSGWREQSSYLSASSMPSAFDATVADRLPSGRHTLDFRTNCRKL